MTEPDIGPIQTSKKILQESLAKHDPVKTYLLFSGGHDSLVSTHVSERILSEMGLNPTVLHIDTTIGVPAVEEYVEETAEQFGWDLRIIRNEEHRGKSYEEWVLDEGFPAARDHKYIYIHLKRCAVEQVVREVKEDRFDRVLFVTGVYKGESDRRAAFHEIERRDGAQVWLNPCFHWTAAQMGQYRHENDLPINEVAAELGKSGECMCNAFGLDDLESLRYVCPALADKIERLDEETTRRGFPWAWDAREVPLRWILEKRGGQKNMFAPLCSDCIDD